MLERAKAQDETWRKRAAVVWENSEGGSADCDGAVGGWWGGGVP